MDDTLGVRGRQGIGDLLNDVQRRARFERRPGSRTPGEGPTSQHLHDQERDPVRGNVEVQDLNDMGMPQRGHDVRLAPKAGQGVRVSHQAGKQHLDGDLRVQPQVGCHVDIAAPSAREKPIDSIGPVEDGTYRQYPGRHAREPTGSARRSTRRSAFRFRCRSPRSHPRTSQARASPPLARRTRPPRSIRR